MTDNDNNAAPAQPQSEQAPAEALARLRPLVEEIIREQGATFGGTTRFIEFSELLRLVPLGERTIRAALRKGWLPHIKLPGGRRILFDFEAVCLALRRYERGGIER